MRRPPIRYSGVELAFIEARQTMPRHELHVEFVKAFARRDVRVSDLKALCSRRGWVTRTRWTPEEDAILRKRYPDTDTASLAKDLGRSLSTTYQRAQRLGLGKNETYLASPAACRLRRGDNVGAAHRFQKGHAPANKGVKRGRGWAPGRMANTQFRKGERGSNWMPIGAERIISGYHYTKVSDVPYVPHTVNWKPTHRLRWEAMHGPIPEGHALKALDGDRLNLDPSNWIAVPRGMLPLLNGRHGIHYDTAPAELKPTLLAIARVRNAANTRDGLTSVERMIKSRRERGVA